MPSIRKLFEAKPRPSQDEVLVLIDRDDRGEDVIKGIFSSEDSLTDWFYQWIRHAWPEHDVEEELQALFDGTSGSSLQIVKMKIDPDHGE